MDIHSEQQVAKAEAIQMIKAKMIPENKKTSISLIIPAYNEEAII